MKKPQTKYLPIFFLFLFTLTACKVQRPRAVLSESKMEEVLYDYHMAKSMSDNLMYNENYKKKLYIEFVFKKHGITEAKFDSSLVWYTRNPEIFGTLYAKVTTRLKAEQENVNNLIAIRDNKPKETMPGDSIDMWIWEKLYRLSGDPLANKLTFTLSSDTNFYARDTLVWSVNHTFINVLDSLEYAIMAMTVQYKDSLVSEVRRVVDSGRQTIVLQSDTFGNIKEVNGFVYYPRGKKPNVLLLSDISLYRYHSTDSLTFERNDSIAPEKQKEEPMMTIEEEVKPVELKEQLPQQRLERPRPNPNLRAAPEEKNLKE
ncbi:DUF4296 domain-containing protein [Bacteroides sp. 214]|uniref:DUF4296 domain-containing protein n=1 Tax=Bacteroides sp. 214 TaxID=2302935 RepID=UPI0013D59D4B|nr:DUF4296 domain-containing protein [Bacteroides sp. 214]NDW12922.1 DUF4296 domain-containing protein [Bacteroides sp. 214]